MRSGCPVKSRKEGGGRHCDPAFTYNGKSTKMRFSCCSSKYMQSLYLMLFILMKAMPGCTPTPITATKLHILVTKITKTLDFDDF